MEVMQEDEAEAAAHLRCWNMGSTFLLQLRQQMNNAVPRLGGSCWNYALEAIIKLLLL
jgi:hypothetical protein